MGVVCPLSAHLFGHHVASPPLHTQRSNALGAIVLKLHWIILCQASVRRHQHRVIQPDPQELHAQQVLHQHHVLQLRDLLKCCWRVGIEGTMTACQHVRIGHSRGGSVQIAGFEEVVADGQALFQNVN